MDSIISGNPFPWLALRSPEFGCPRSCSERARARLLDDGIAGCKQASFHPLLPGAGSLKVVAGGIGTEHCFVAAECVLR